MKSKPLSHEIAEMLARQIDAGIYPLGSRLPAERELAEQYGVSRVTIREAEIALQALGRIRIKTGSGVYVEETAPDRERAFPEISAFELTEARALFESEAAALAAEQMDDKTLGILQEHVETMSTSSLDEAARDAADQAFHRTIAAASNNAAILYVIESLWKMRDEIEAVKAVYNTICRKDRDSLAREHDGILNALRAHDPNAARAAMREHFRRLLESMLDLTHQQAMEDLRRKADESRNRYLNSAGV